MKIENKEFVKMFENVIDYKLLKNTDLNNDKRIREHTINENTKFFKLTRKNFFKDIKTINCGKCGKTLNLILESKEPYIITCNCGCSYFFDCIDGFLKSIIKIEDGDYRFEKYKKYCPSNKNSLRIRSYNKGNNVIFVIPNEKYNDSVIKCFEELKNKFNEENI